MIFFSILSGALDVAGIGALAYFIRFTQPINDYYILRTACYLSVALTSFFILKNLLITTLTKIQATFAFNEATFQSIKTLRSIFNRNELFFRNTETGALLSDLMYVPTSFANGVILGYIMLLSELSVMALMLLFLSLVSFQISIGLILLFAPLAFFSYRKIKNEIEALGNKRNEIVKRSQDVLIQGVQGHTDAKLYNRAVYFEDKFRLLQEQTSLVDSRVYTLNNMPSRLMEVFAVVAFCLVYLFTISTGNIASVSFNLGLFAAAAFRLLPSINRSINALLRIRNHWFAIDTLLEYKKSQSADNLMETKAEFKKCIAIHDMHYNYGENQVCRVKHFELIKGSCIGIYGKTGEGKSTFLQLLMQLITPKSGNVTIDSKIVDNSNVWPYQQLFAYIRQDVFILNGSLQENISLAESETCNTQLANEIARRLGLDQLINTLHRQNEAGEAGSNLSGGQKKLIGLARALYFNKEVLILDETLSSMDPETMNNTLQVLKEEQNKGKTIIIVSHQESSFRGCDTIYEFTNGNLIIAN